MKTEFDERIEHDLRFALPELNKGQAYLLGLELVILPENVDQPVALSPFPSVVSDVSGRIERGTVAPSVEKFGFTLQPALPQVEVLCAVFCHPVDAQTA